MKSSIPKDLMQLAYDRRETRHDYRAPHGDGNEGVYGRRFAAPAKSSARFPIVTGKDAMFLCVYGIPVIYGFRKGARAMLKGERSRFALQQSSNKQYLCHHTAANQQPYNTLRHNA